MLSALQGKKTYIIVLITVLGILAEKVLGIDIPGFEVGPDWLTDLLTVLGLGTLRAGVSKVG